MADLHGPVLRWECAERLCRRWRGSRQDRRILSLLGRVTAERAGIPVVLQLPGWETAGKGRSAMPVSRWVTAENAEAALFGVGWNDDVLDEDQRPRFDLWRMGSSPRARFPRNVARITNSPRKVRPGHYG